MDSLDAVIIGAGACGLMCAAQAAKRGKKVLVLEKNSQAGAKILISGGGRCNYTNIHTTAANFIGADKKYIDTILQQWTVKDTIHFFEQHGIEGKEKTLGQLFPTTNKAKDIVNSFLKECENQTILYTIDVVDIAVELHGYTIRYEENGVLKQIFTKKLVIATGGLPIPKMGATDFALQLAKKQDLKLHTTAPALVPLVVKHQDREWYEKLAGISVFAKVKVDTITFEENILFTHWGISGPAILQISSYWRLAKTIHMDLHPAFSIPKHIQGLLHLDGRKTLQSILQPLLPNRLVESFREYLPLNKKIAELSKVEYQIINKYIHLFEVEPAGDKGYEKAEVMRGGIATSELVTATLEIKKMPHCYVGGECVDVTGWLGGYNFQWAWACGYVIAQQL